MLRPALSGAFFFCLANTPAALAQAADADVLRLPGTGTAKVAPPGERPTRFVPGGGLLLSFDTNEDGRVTLTEREQGVRRAFETADTNEDGVLSAFEQQAWAASLPTRDDSLANPVRFDPNLDRFVSLDEFAHVVQVIANAYVDRPSGDVLIAALKAPEQRRVERETIPIDPQRAPRGNS